MSDKGYVWLILLIAGLVFVFGGCQRQYYYEPGYPYDCVHNYRILWTMETTPQFSWEGSAEDCAGWF